MVKVYACLWTGTDLPAFSAGQYDEGYVYALQRGLARHWPEAELVMLTDESFDLQNVKQIPFTESWAGWWKRLEVFRPDLWPAAGERAVLLDLDMILVGDCTWIGEWNLAPIGVPIDPIFDWLCCSTVITWDREGAELMWNAANAHPRGLKYMGRPSEMALLRALHKDLAWPPLELAPSKLLSYKIHVNRAGYPWTDPHVSIVYCHGHPKPHHLQPTDDELYQAWTTGAR